MSRFKRGANTRRPSNIRQALRAGSVRFTQRIAIDKGRALSLISSLAAGFIRKRTADGKDISGAPFKPYSPMYREMLTKGGEDANQVDLTVTGGLLASINERKRTVTAHGGSVVVGPDTGTSPRVSFRDGRAVRTGGRSPPHNVIGAWLHFGRGRMPPRKFLGLTPRERQKISKALTRASAKVLKEERGR